jgi:hypothetical protein
MAKVIVGFGKYNGYFLPEIPDALLERLVTRFPLDAHDYDLSDAEKLLITVAVHRR